VKVPAGISLNVISIGWSSHPTAINNINNRSASFVFIEAVPW
jgi:hypothetical protein